MMGSPTLAHVLVLSMLLVGATSLSAPKLLGTFAFHSAGFVSLLRNESSSGVKYDLLLSSFGFSKTDVAVVVDVGSQLKDIPNIKPRSINTDMKWPNFITGVPGKF